MRQVTQQLPVAYRGRRTSRGAIVEAQPSTATSCPLDPRLGTCLARRQPSHDPIPPFVVQVLYNPPLFRALAVVRDFT